jgi:hypothetical protein
MIGSVEALGVFLLAVLPGFIALGASAAGRAPRRVRGPLGELGTAMTVSLVGWSVLYLWRGDVLLPVVLGGSGHSVSERLDAFAELVGLALAIGVGLGVGLRVLVALRRIYVFRDMPDSLIGAVRKSGIRSGLWNRLVVRLAHELNDRALPSAAWDRLLSRLDNRHETVLCRVATRLGDEVFGIVAQDGFMDWKADGCDLLLVPELIREHNGALVPVPGSKGVFIPGSEIAHVHAVTYPGKVTLG